MLLRFQRLQSSSPAMFAAILIAASLFSGCTKPTEPAKPDGGKGGASAGETAMKPGGETSAQPAAGKFKDGRAVLEAMAAAYRKAQRYQDNGTVRLVAQTRGEKPYDKTYDFSAAFERPNKVHLDIYDAHIRCDGKKYHAFTKELRGQVVEKDAPDGFDFRKLYNDPFLLERVSVGGPAGGPPQPTLFWEKDPLKIMLTEGDEPRLGEPGEIDGKKCYRVQVLRPEGLIVYWIRAGLAGSAAGGVSHRRPALVAGAAVGRRGR